jgi:Tfp pilus assembly protein PilW
MKELQMKEGGYTLVELIVAVGLFALVMLLTSGAYLMMISLNRHAQGIATGIDNLSFALETMTRDIRTGSGYSSDGTTFSFTNANGSSVSYVRSTSSLYCGASGNGCLVRTSGGSSVAITDPSVDITSLSFYTAGLPKGDIQQPRVTIVIKGTVVYAAGRSEEFSIETGATMRGSDL